MVTKYTIVCSMIRWFVVQCDVTGDVVGDAGASMLAGMLSVNNTSLRSLDLRGAELRSLLGV